MVLCYKKKIGVKYFINYCDNLNIFNISYILRNILLFKCKNFSRDIIVFN
ncbi:hypothetical protein A1OE_1132 [Candidatus Endolissoclinum faulkneri L2]|uniref:Uncharacterized protein n=1 Tax=Candidatus Endolissoclinum faulkneri L2 TaxID=1193729 RepID=K7YI80_9PROT|nr:hypothetical protein A1OE_1132 [Candidatus Endolissoclinum faulkneri L2]